MDALAPGTKTEMLALRDGTVEKSWMPAQRRGDRTYVGKIHNERILGHLDGDGLAGGGIKNQSSHARLQS